MDGDDDDDGSWMVMMMMDHGSWMVMMICMYVLPCVSPQVGFLNNN